MEKQQSKLIKKLKKQSQGCLLDCQLFEDELRIELQGKGITDTIYFAYITNDSFPQELKFIFAELSELYTFLQDSTRPNFQMESPSKLTLLVPIMSRISRIPIYLSEKKLTKDQIIDQLQRQVQRLKQIQEKYNSLVANQKPIEAVQGSSDSVAIRKQNEELRRQIIRLGLVNKKLKEQGSKGQANKVKDFKAELNANAISQLQEENTVLKAQKEQLTKQVESLITKVQSLQSQLNSQDMIIKELNEQSLNTSNLIKDMTNQSNLMQSPNIRQQQIPIINPEAQILLFKPLTTSINFRFFQFKNNILSKNNVTTSGQGRLLPCATPIPKTGRYFYKLKMKFPQDPPNIRVGIVGRDLTNEAYINGGDEDGLMYYCYSQGKEMIYEGQMRLQGFNLFKNDVLIIVVDQDRKEVEWHVQGLHYLTSKYTNSMRSSQNIYMFIQLWTNGDQVEILTA